MEVRRTVPVKLDMSEEDATLLSETIDEFLWACNYVVSAASDGEWVETRASKLQSLTYDDVRDATRLHSNHVQSARNRAVDALKSVITTWKRGETASLPTFTSRFCEYNHRNATFSDDSVSLSTVDGRITADYVLPTGDDIPHTKYLTSDEWKITGATLHSRNNSFYLHVRTKADVDAPDLPENGTVLGVDLGVKNIAVTSTGRFWSADEFNHWRREYQKRRGSLQQCGTRWAHENVESVGHTEKGRFEQHLHRVANELLEEAREYDCSYIAFENLTHIRENVPRATWQHVWAFRRLFDYVSYKAKPLGITVEQVNPKNTSRRCSSCGFTHKSNRDSESFLCQKCGYANHADYNAAKNIGLKLLRGQTGTEGGAPIGVRLNSGMLNANGVTSVPDLVRAGVHAEYHGL